MRRDRRLKARWRWLLLPPLAFLLFSAASRPAMTVVTPLLSEIGSDLSMSPTQLGLLTSIPVLLFGLATPLASFVLRKWGVNTCVFVTLLLILMGSCIRCMGDASIVLVATAILGCGMTIGNTAGPMIIGRDFRRHTALMTSLFTSSCNVTIAISTALVIPLSSVIGWRWAVLFWSIAPTIPSILLWYLVYPLGVDGVRESIHNESNSKLDEIMSHGGYSCGSPSHTKHALLSPMVWLITIAFCAHTFSYYTAASWLPEALKELASLSEKNAGLATSIFHFTGIFGPIIVPVLYKVFRWNDVWVTGATSIGWCTLPIGALFFPHWWAIWLTTSGIAQGAFYTVLFTMIIERSRSLDENRQISTFVQTIAYCIAALGPVAMGWIRTSTGSWTFPLSIIAFASCVMVVCGYLAARNNSFQSLESSVSHIDRQDMRVSSRQDCAQNARGNTSAPERPYCVDEKEIVQ